MESEQYKRFFTRISTVSVTVGVLALHGDFAEHLRLLAFMNADAREVRSLADLRGVTHLIIPGGESTVMSLLLSRMALDQEIRARVHDGELAVYGTCAGAILMASEVTGKHPPPTLSLMDMTIERNAYGSQAHSFQEPITIQGIQKPVSVSFIRAPKIVRVGPGVEVLASHGDNPALVREGRLLAGTFHPEVRGETVIHRIFLRL